MNANLSILHLVLNASFVVQLVMLLLVAVSVASWAAIFRKLFALKRVKALNETFEREFWSGTSLNDLYASAAQNAKTAGPMERIFASGMREYQKLRERHIQDTGTLLDGARRAMRASYQREMDNAESSLSLLASAGYEAFDQSEREGLVHDAVARTDSRPAGGDHDVGAHQLVIECLAKRARVETFDGQLLLGRFRHYSSLSDRAASSRSERPTSRVASTVLLGHDATHAAGQWPKPQPARHARA